MFDSQVLFFTVPAIVGTLFFLFRVALMMLGGFGDADLDTDVDMDVDMDVDVDADVDADVAHADSTVAFNVLTIQGLGAFLMGFGWFGLCAKLTFELDAVWSVVVGAAGGALLLWVLVWLMRAIYSLQGSGNISIHSAVGREGDVYATVPAQGEGRGRVRLVINDRARIYNAISDGSEFPSHTRVRVVKANDDNTITVTAIG